MSEIASAPITVINPRTFTIEGSTVCIVAIHAIVPSPIPPMNRTVEMIGTLVFGILY
jgi:hypothetical protein